ncbi:MAG: WYL domain-containing protein [Eubacterium sp.]|nr:WYL domain-containing protein [Eubacterium sp.]
MTNIKKDKDTVKPRLLVLAKMFYEHTDEEHQWTNTEILKYLEEHDVPANEKTLRGDVRWLQKLGLDIVKIVSRPNRYYWRNREFTMPELKLLIDAVSASRFITKKKSHDLGDKLAELASEHQKKELHRNVYATNRVKNRNEGIYGMVDVINEAINRKKKITFQYNYYDADLKPALKNDGEVYELSPYALYWNEDYYYVVGWSDKHGNVSAFRVDRLVKPKIKDEKAHRRPEDFDIDDYSRRIFEMFDGEPTIVRLECRNHFAKYIVDRFGTRLETKPVSDDSFEVEVEVSLSPTFYAWVFQFGGGIRIVSPEKAVDEIKEMAGKILE